MTHRCRHCDRMLDVEAFPLGKPRADGTRHPSDYCFECRSACALTGIVLRGGGREAYRRKQREHQQRYRVRKTVAAA